MLSMQEKHFRHTHTHTHTADVHTSGTENLDEPPIRRASRVFNAKLQMYKRKYSVNFSYLFF